MYFNDGWGLLKLYSWKNLSITHLACWNVWKFMLPDTVFFDGFVECFYVSILVRSILSCNFLFYSIDFQCVHELSRRVLRTTITPCCYQMWFRRRSYSIWKPFQYWSGPHFFGNAFSITWCILLTNIYHLCLLLCYYTGIHKIVDTFLAGWWLLITM